MPNRDCQEAVPVTVSNVFLFQCDLVQRLVRHPLPLLHFALPHCFRLPLFLTTMAALPIGVYVLCVDPFCIGWFLAADLAFNAILGAVFGAAGVALGCPVAAWCTAGLFVVYFVAMTAVRPCSRHLDTALLASITLLQCVAATITACALSGLISEANVPPAEEAGRATRDREATGEIQRRALNDLRRSRRKQRAAAADNESSRRARSIPAGQEVPYSLLLVPKVQGAHELLFSSNDEAESSHSNVSSDAGAGRSVAASRLDPLHSQLLAHRNRTRRSRAQSSERRGKFVSSDTVANESHLSIRLRSSSSSPRRGLRAPSNPLVAALELPRPFEALSGLSASLLGDSPWVAVRSDPADALPDFGQSSLRTAGSRPFPVTDTVRPPCTAADCSDSSAQSQRSYSSDDRDASPAQPRGPSPGAAATGTQFAPLQSEGDPWWDLQRQQFRELHEDSVRIASQAQYHRVRASDLVELPRPPSRHRAPQSPEASVEYHEL
jgi:hypothetical protein